MVDYPVSPRRVVPDDVPFSTDKRTGQTLNAAPVVGREFAGAPSKNAARTNADTGVLLAAAAGGRIFEGDVGCGSYLDGDKLEGIVLARRQLKHPPVVQPGPKVAQRLGR